MSGFFITDTAYATVSATIDQNVYTWGDNLAITGKLDSSVATTITATTYNSTGSVQTLSSESSGGSPNTFTITSAINATSYPEGDYWLILSDGTSSVNMSFWVTPESITLEPYMVNSGTDIINISTSTIITSSDALGAGSNLTEVLNMSKSSPQTIHYGNYSIGGRTYHFVLVDQTNASDYDRLYIDGNTNFAFSNDTEDIGEVEYQALKKGSIFSNGTGAGDFKFIIGEIEKDTGNKLILWKPMGRPPTNTDNINFVILAKNDTNMVSEPIKVEVYNSTGQNVTVPYYLDSSEYGWLNVTLPSLSSGTYTVKLNDTIGSMTFFVEAFKMFATIADTSNNPTYSFSQGSTARLIVTSKNSTGPFNLSAFNATFYYPNGTTSIKTKADFTQSADGVYNYDYSIGTSTGRYSVSVSGSDESGNTQTASASFEAQSVGFEAEAINTRYIEDADSSGAMVNAFPPGSNVTIMTFLTNVTAGGLTAKGPEGFQGLVTPENCSSSITLKELKDENGVSYTVSYQVMNLSSAMEFLNVEGEAPPAELLSQCMIIFNAPNKTGSTFRAEIKMKYVSEEKYAGVIFGVQRLYASGSTVDFKGDDFGFFAPNSTVRIKLKVKDLSTDEELLPENITSGKIIGLQKVFPSFKDVLSNSTLRGTLNESIVNGTITFTSPLDEGFYTMKFRFTADVGGATETGIGDAFFMLKKYMVWGQMYGADQGQFYAKQGQNITLVVTVMDINNAQTVFGGYNSQKSCTGCTGFVVSASEIRNDQQFKTFSDTDYTILKGSIINSTNPVTNLTIVPGNNMQTGWYSMDIVVTDPLTNATYFGWGGFEIRNFWVDAQRAYWNGNNVSGYSFNDMMGPNMGGETFGIDSSVEFIVTAKEPNNFQPQGLTLSSAPEVVSIMSEASWPPVAMSGYTATVSNRTVAVCRVMGEGMPVCDQNFSTYVVNITLPEGEIGDFMANVRINVSGKTDVGTFRFSMSSYNVNSAYRQNSFPPLYATTENLIVNFSGTELEGGDKAGVHNLTNVTIMEFFSSKVGRPVKMKYGQNYTTDCDLTNKDGQFCQINVTLASLQSGEYNVRFAVVDSPNATDQKITEIFFKIQGTIISIPSIEQAWVWQTDMASKKIESDISRAEWSSCQDIKTTAVPGQYYFCGQYFEQGNGQGPGQQQQFNLTVQNVSSTKDLYGYVSMTGNNGQWFFGDAMITKQRMCMYTNGTHMWINVSAYDEGTQLCNLTQTTPITLNEVFTDSEGGQWRLDTIGDQSFTVTGLDTLYDTGAMINTSYTKSGKIKFGQLQENQFGAFLRDSSGGSRKGIDLTGDGYTNGTAYFAIMDSVTSGVYDTFFFSTTSNFSTMMSVNDVDRNSRELGEGASKDKLTLLSIDPKGQTVKFYSKQVGDWAQLGDVKLGNNLTIPIIVTSPDGTDRTELVSVTGYKNMQTWKLETKALVTDQNITGIGELRFNTSELGATGSYSFAIETSSDKVDEWKWPMATVRGFLIDGDLGEAMYISNFKQVSIVSKKGEDGIIYLQSDRRNESAGIVDGVLSNARGKNTNECTFSGNSSEIGQEAMVFEDTNNGQPYYFFYNASVTPKTIYVNPTACSFNVSDLGTAYEEGSTLIMNRYGRNYNVTVLKIDELVQYGSGRIDFGVAGVNASVILPILNRSMGDPAWSYEWAYMQNVSVFGTYYDVILANDTTYNYEWCNLEPQYGGECAKRAWFVPRSIGNFSSLIPTVTNASIGGNLTPELYLTAMGPRGNEGITVGNYSALGTGQRPSIGSMPLADNSPVYFATINETEIDYDLNKDDLKNATFYALATDSDFNSVSSPTAMLVDDDTEFMQYAANQGQIPLDFSSTENYNINPSAGDIPEEWGNLPSGTSEGNAQFGNTSQNNVMWEDMPSWNLPFFNNTHMLLKKQKWQVDLDQPVDVLLKAYNFNLQPIANANISVTQVGRSSWMGFNKLIENTDYTVNYTSTSTNAYGYGLLKVSPISNGGNWIPANYQIIVTVQTPQGNESYESWFNPGQSPGPGP